MAGADFTVSMVLRAVNQMSPIIQQTTRQLRQLQTQIDQLNATSNKGTWFDRAITNVDRFQGKLKTAQDAMDKLVKSGEKDLLTGGIMALPLVEAIKSAAKVQNQQTSLQLSGMSKAQVDLLTTQAQQTMRKTMFNTSQVLGIDQSLAQVGMNYSKIRNVGISATYLAELEANRNGADPNETAKQFAQMAEQLQISMDPKKVNQLADLVNRISTITSASVATLSDSSRYFNLVGKIQGLSVSDIMMTQGLAARYGLEGSIGGTHLKDFFERLNPQTHMGTTMGQPIVRAFEQMGWLKNVELNKKGQIVGGTDVFHDSHGNLIDASKIFGILGQTYERMGNKEQFNALMTKIFLQQGGTIAAAVAQNPKLFATMGQQMANVPTVHQGISAYQQTFNQQFRSFTSTLADFGRQVGTMLLPSLTGYLKQLNANLPKLQMFIDKNKNLIKTLAEVWAGLAAFKIGSGIAKIAIGAPMREVFGAARFGTGMVKGGLRGARAFSRARSAYREFRQLDAGNGMAIEAALQQGIGMKPTAAIKATVNAMKSLGSSTARVASSFANVSAKTAMTTARFIANGAATVSVKTAQLAVAAASRTWAAVQWLVNAALTANPIGLIIVGVGVLIGVIVLLVTHWKTCVKWLQNAWNWFKHLGAGAQSSIAMIMPIVGIPALIIAHWKGIVSFFDGIWKHIKPIIDGAINGAESIIKGAQGPANSPVLSRFGPGIGGPLAASSGGNSNVTINHTYNVQSTSPSGAASEIQKKQDKYYNSRFPLGAH